MITLTDKGAEKVQEFLSTQNAVAETAGLRVGVRGGGCSGFQYALAFDEQRDGDEVFEDKGIRLLVDRPSLPYVRGSVIDSSTASRGPASRSRTPTWSRPVAAVPRSASPKKKKSQRSEGRAPTGVASDEASLWPVSAAVAEVAPAPSPQLTAHGSRLTAVAN